MLLRLLPNALLLLLPPLHLPLLLQLVQVLLPVLL